MERPSGGAECRSFHGQEGQKPSVNLLGLFGENRCDRFKIMGAKLDVGEGIRFISRSVLSRMGANVTSQGKVTNVEHIVGYLLCFGIVSGARNQPPETRSLGIAISLGTKATPILVSPALSPKLQMKSLFLVFANHGKPGTAIRYNLSIS